MSDRERSLWDILGTEPTGDERALKRAYAKRLKVTRPEDDPAAFQELRDAYEYALRIAAQEGESSQQSSASPLELAESGTLSAVSAPLLLAQNALQDWCANNSISPLESLSVVGASEQLLDFAVREQFELQALGYAASAACSDDERAALVEHFEWYGYGPMQRLQRINSEAAHAMIGRYNAAHSHAILMRSDHQCQAALTALLAPVPPAYSGLLGDQGFTRALLALITRLRWQHPDFLAYRINPEVLAWWEQQASEKKYFVNTAAYSFLAGLVLFIIILISFVGKLEEIDFFIPLVFLGAQAITFALFAVLAFHPPRKAQAWLARLKESRVYLSWDERRHQANWQLGWLVPYTLLSLPLFLPEIYRPLLYVMLPGLLACALFALLAVSVVLRWYQMLLLILMAIVTAFCMWRCGFGGYGSYVLILFCICLLAQAVRGGVRLFLASGWRPARLRMTRKAWLLSLPVWCVLQIPGVLPPALSVLLTWLWCLSGILLSRFTPFKLSPVAVIWPFMALYGGWDKVRAYFGSLPDTRLVFMMPLLLVVAVFMLTNMYHAEQDEHYFS